MAENTQGVVVHLPDGDAAKQEAVLRNAANLLRALGRQTPVELVTHGPGVTLCTGESGLAAQLGELQRAGAAVCACANTLAARELAENALLPGVTVVPSGVAHLVQRQRSGWAYLRP